MTDAPTNETRNARTPAGVANGRSGGAQQDVGAVTGLALRGRRPAARVAMTEQQLLGAAQAGDEDAFSRLIDPYRRELYAHCYRMLASCADGEDALQDALLGAWRGLRRFEGRSSLRSWLYTITTNACLRIVARRPKRVLPLDYGPSADPHNPIGEPLVESVWIEPLADATLADVATPATRYEQREAVELAFIAALQHLPARQRAVLLLRDVLGFSARETAEALDTTPVSIDSALQRAHKAVDARLPERSQQETLGSLDDRDLRRVVERFVVAWERADVDAIVSMLAEDAVLAMPPNPSWFAGRDAIAAFLAAIALAPTTPHTGSCPSRPTARSRSATTAGGRSRTRSCAMRSPCCPCATRRSNRSRSSGAPMHSRGSSCPSTSRCEHQRRSVPSSHASRIEPEASSRRRLAWTVTVTGDGSSRQRVSASDLWACAVDDVVCMASPLGLVLVVSW